MRLPDACVEISACLKIFQKLGIRSAKFLPTANSSWPDRCFLLPRGRAVFIDFKTQDKKKNSHKYPEKRKDLNGLGYPYAVCNSAEDAYKFILTEIHRP